MSIIETAKPVTHTQSLFRPEAVRPRRCWTVAEYHRMAEVGLLTKDDRVELIDGEIIEMAPIGSPHGGEVKYLIRCFSPLLSQDRIVLGVQDPISLPNDSEPQPDLAILRWRDDFYRTSHPVPADVILLIEVADSTARYDREVKIPLYARHGIPEVWLVDLQKRQLEIHRQPKQGEYRQVNAFSSGSVSPERLPEITIDLAQLFPA